MCWLCDFNKTEPTDKQKAMAYELFSKFCDVLDECAQLPQQSPSFENACNVAADLMRATNRRPVEKVSETVGRAIVEEMQKMFGPDVEIELMGSTSLNVNHGRRATDNVLPMRGKLDAETEKLFNAIETPIDGKVH